MDDSAPRPLDAARQEQVRRRLAAARHDGPPPAEVVDRLDATLADLVAERTASHPGTDRGVVPLKRRRWATGLLAAAAVTVIGFGTTQVISGTGSSEDAMSAGEEAVLDDRAESGGQEGAGADAETPTLDEGRDDGSRAPEPTPESADVLDGIPLSRLEPLDRVTLQSDLQELTAGLPVRRHANVAPEAYSNTAAERRAIKGARRAGCGPAAPPDDTLLLAARFRGDPAVVTVRAPWPGYRVAEVYPCPPGSPSRTPAESILLLPR